MLHPRVGGDDKIAGEPGAEKHHERGEPMSAGSEALFTKEKKAEEGGLKKKRKHAFHCECLTDHAARGSRKLRPVGAKLKFHGDSGDNAESKTDAENLGPEARCLIPDSVSGAERERVENKNQKSQAHVELRENVMKRDGEGEMKAVDGQCVFHALPGTTIE